MKRTLFVASIFFGDFSVKSDLVFGFFERNVQVLAEMLAQRILAPIAGDLPNKLYRHLVTVLSLIITNWRHRVLVASPEPPPFDLIIDEILGANFL
jgi:hypothetical protein